MCALCRQQVVPVVRLPTVAWQRGENIINHEGAMKGESNRDLLE